MSTIKNQLTYRAQSSRDGALMLNAAEYIDELLEALMFASCRVVCNSSEQQIEWNKKAALLLYKGLQS